MYAAFYTNQNYIEQNLCVNKDKPWMHCDGQCQLNKKLADDNKQSSNNPIQKAADGMSALFVLPIVQQTNFVQGVLSVPMNGYYIPFVEQSAEQDILHPPVLS